MLKTPKYILVLLVENVKGYLIQIDTITEIIREKTMNKDFVVLENLFHCYNEVG